MYKDSYGHATNQQNPLIVTQAKKRLQQNFLNTGEGVNAPIAPPLPHVDGHDNIENFNNEITNK